MVTRRKARPREILKSIALANVVNIQGLNCGDIWPMKSTTAAPPVFEERLLGGRELGLRWSCHPKVAYARAIKHGARPVRFNARTVKFRLSEIIRIEEEATATPASILEGVGA
jgi:hypothetical protein